MKVWTSSDPSRAASIVSFQPGSLDTGKLIAALEHDGVVGATRGGKDRPGIRYSPHFYNTIEDIDRGVAAIAKYMKTGV